MYVHFVFAIRNFTIAAVPLLEELRYYYEITIFVGCSKANVFNIPNMYTIN